MSEKLSRKVLSLRAVIRIVAALSFAVYELLHFLRLVPDRLHEGLVIALLIFVIEQAIEIGLELSSAREEDNRAMLVKTLTRHPGVFRDLLIDLHDQVTRSLEIQHDGFIVNHRALAISSYLEFWKILIEEQEKRGKGSPLHVEAIHSGPTYVWTAETPQGKLIYERHKQFIDQGGKVTRILCGRGEKPDSEFARAAKRMEQVNIQVRYYDIDSEKVGHSFVWDFLKIAGTNQVVVWDSFSKAAEQNIEKAVYRHSLKYDDVDIQHLWRDILKNSIEIKANKIDCEKPE